MRRDESYRVRAGQRPRLTAITHSRVPEVSTAELDDVVRWEDDYVRTPGRTAHSDHNRGTHGAHRAPTGEKPCRT